MSRPRTQKERVLAALRREPLTQVDFLAPSTCDGGPPIIRLPARIDELRQDGHDIRIVGRRHSCGLYRLHESADSAPAESSPDPGMGTGRHEAPASEPMFDRSIGTPPPRSAVLGVDE